MSLFYLLEKQGLCIFIFPKAIEEVSQYCFGFLRVYFGLVLYVCILDLRFAEVI